MIKVVIPNIKSPTKKYHITNEALQIPVVSVLVFANPKVTIFVIVEGSLMVVVSLNVQPNNGCCSALYSHSSFSDKISPPNILSTTTTLSLSIQSPSIHSCCLPQSPSFL